MKFHNTFDLRKTKRISATALLAFVLAAMGSLLASCRPRTAGTKGGFTPLPEWHHITSQAGRFSVESPVTLKEDTDSIEIPQNFAIEIHTFADEDSDAYAVAYCDYPADYVNQVGADRILDGVRDGIVAVNDKFALVEEFSHPLVVCITRIEHYSV